MAGKAKSKEEAWVEGFKKNGESDSGELTKAYVKEHYPDKKDWHSAGGPESTKFYKLAFGEDKERPKKAKPTGKRRKRRGGRPKGSKNKTTAATTTQTASTGGTGVIAALKDAVAKLGKEDAKQIIDLMP